MPAFSRAEILRLLKALDEELRDDGIRGEVYVAGGAVMCLAFEARPSTRDLDATFKPSAAVRAAAVRVAAREGLPDHWLNDAVKACLSDRGSYDLFLERDNLRVFCADARYMLAMKCQAMRLGEGYRDEEDVRYLLRHLGIERLDDALEIIARYYALESLPAVARAALAELLPGAPAKRPSRRRSR